MDSSHSETEDSSPVKHSKGLQCGTYFHKRKFRKTNDFIVEDLTDVRRSSHNLYKKNKPRNSFLPKVDDVKFTSSLLSNPSKPLLPHKIKILNNLKLYRQKLEMGYTVKTIPFGSEETKIKRLRLKKAKGIWRPVEESMKPELYIPLIPLEKTNLLTNMQLKQLTGDTFNKSRQLECSTKSMLESFRCCTVILKQLTMDEINNILKKNLNETQNLHRPEPEFFNPPITSSPNITNNSNVINSTIDYSKDEEEEKCCSKGISNNASSEVNTTYDIAESLVKTPNIKKKLTRQDSLRGTPTNSNRHVTFNDTSIIIYDSNTLCTFSTPTLFAEDRNDDIKRKSSILDSKAESPRTSVLGNANSSRKNSELQLSLTKPKKQRDRQYFAKVHKRMFDRMLDIKQHAEEKLKRSQLLLSGRKPSIGAKKKLINDNVPTVNKGKVAKILINKTVTKDKLDIKEKNKNSVFRKQQIVAFANKVCPNPDSSRENNKVFVKGIRSNRRFELLMKLRKSQNN
ncbi:hypothetical protein FQR65_LT03015 [Abscondita terminalis]|nr:hypothetical protein FQR65_LT03015 [Abscondita terminalis]